jgi:hypothetical protein
MNIVLNARTIIASMLITFGVFVPKVLLFFGLEHEYLTTITSLWAVFLIILLAEFLLFWTLIRNVKTIVFAIILAVIVALIITLVLGG